jgi:hypothetical protein
MMTNPNNGIPPAKPRVATKELPWVEVQKRTNRKCGSVSKIPPNPFEDVFTLTNQAPPTPKTEIRALYFEAGQSQFERLP